MVLGERTVCDLVDTPAGLSGHWSLRELSSLARDLGLLLARGGRRGGGLGWEEIGSVSSEEEISLHWTVSAGGEDTQSSPLAGAGGGGVGVRDSLASSLASSVVLVTRARSSVAQKGITPALAVSRLTN